MNPLLTIRFALRHGAWAHVSGLIIAVGTILSGSAALAKETDAATHPVAPTSAELKAFVLKSLDGYPGFDADGLLTRSQVTRVVALLGIKGWKLDNSDELMKRTLADNDFLIRELNDEAGKKFLEKIGQVEGSLDRVDRLARMPQGENNIHDLIRKVPNGHEWITAMSNTPYGRRMAKQLEQAQGGADFNEPTRRIYTVQDLVAALDGHLVRK